MAKKDPKDFVKKLRKSIDFDEVMSSIPTEDQMYAEQNADDECVKWLRSLVATMAVGDIQRIDTAPQYIATIHKKAEGLFDYFVSNETGQVILEQPSVTIEMIVKELEIRGYISKLFLLPTAPAELEPAIAKTPTIIRISLGDMQIEIQKSLNKVAKSALVPNTIRKSLSIFRKSTASYLNLTSDTQAAKEILNQWDLHGERFNQILFGVEQISKAKKG